MGAIAKDQYTGNAGTSAPDVGTVTRPYKSLAKDMRDVADDLAGLKSQANGVISGLGVGVPTTPSAQITGSGNTTWNVNIAAGFVSAGGVEKEFAAQPDYAVHSGSNLLSATGKSVTAAIVAKNVMGTVTLQVVKGSEANTGSQLAPTDAQIQTAVGAGNAFVKVAELTINRTGATTVTQSQDNTKRQTFANATGLTLKTTKA